MDEEKPGDGRLEGGARIPSSLGRALLNADNQYLKDTAKGMYDSASFHVISNTAILAEIANGCMWEVRHLTIPEIEKCIVGKPLIRAVPVDRDATPPLPGEGWESVGAGTAGKGAKAAMREDYGNAPMDPTEDRTLYEGSSRYDIRFTLRLPKSEQLLEIVLLVDVEVQNRAGSLPYDLDVREIMYAARMLSAQGLDYGNIRKVYSIWIVCDPEEGAENTIVPYAMGVDNGDGTMTRAPKGIDKLAVVTVNLGNAEDVDPAAGPRERLLHLLDVVLDTEMPYGEKSRTLEDVYRIPMTGEFKKEMMEMAGLGARIAAEHERIGQERGEQIGQERGEQIGQKRGEQIGEVRGTIETCLSLDQTPEATVRLVANRWHMSEQEARQTYDEYMASRLDPGTSR